VKWSSLYAAARADRLCWLAVLGGVHFCDTLPVILMPADQPSIKTKTLPDGSVLVQSARGSARLRRLGTGVLLYVCTGSLSAGFYEPMVTVAQGEMDRARSVIMFVDGWELHSVDTGFREAWTEWFKTHKERFVMRLLVRSKLMEMAASLANLFTGLSVIKTYSNCAHWERACMQDFPTFRRGERVTE